jgi:hypothetical protein
MGEMISPEEEKYILTRAYVPEQGQNEMGSTLADPLIDRLVTNRGLLVVHAWSPGDKFRRPPKAKAPGHFCY